jgi:hypothetical protein
LGFFILEEVDSEEKGKMGFAAVNCAGEGFP